ncbi:hypothetical protein Pelo_16614 [Pelomyxa schiedti]|nr:hypothetical protein Pelo_16614 [Pelomyxa schiedti]
MFQRNMVTSELEIERQRQRREARGPRRDRLAEATAADWGMCKDADKSCYTVVVPGLMPWEVTTENIEAKWKAHGGPMGKGGRLQKKYDQLVRRELQTFASGRNMFRCDENSFIFSVILDLVEPYLLTTTDLGMLESFDYLVNVPKERLVRVLNMPAVVKSTAPAPPKINWREEPVEEDDSDDNEDDEEEEDDWNVEGGPWDSDE